MTSQQGASACWPALEAGLAFSNSSVALVHGMARPLGAKFGIAHGLSNAMLLETITAFSLSGNPQAMPGWPAP